MKNYLGLLLVLFLMPHLNAELTHSIQHHDDLCEIQINFTVPPNTVTYYDYLKISVDNPDIQLLSWQADCEPTMQYDDAFKENKKVFTKDFRITARAKKTGPAFPTEAHLHCAYYSSEHKTVREDLFLITAPERVVTTASEPNSHQELQTLIDTTAIPEQKTPSFSERIKSLVEKTDSLAMRLLLVLLLGILVSFTPCIYPMIPITIGILQGRAKQSVLHNFLTGLSYTMGIATTFASLGLISAYTGMIFGSIMANPFVILGIVAMLIYLALTMFDVVQMRMPKAFSSNMFGTSKGGSLLSAFFFGAASGIVASPCSSPALLMLLSLTTTMGNPYFGFILLFTFGIGLSIPLLIIGTFSSSLSMLPQAGMWMVEIKHFFGLLLLGMCIYFLKTVLPAAVISWLVVAFVIGSGSYYLYTARLAATPRIAMIKNLLGIALLALSVHLFFKAYQSVTKPTAAPHSFWECDYQAALERAKAENKMLFINVGAPFCSICHALDDTLFQHEAVMEAICKCVPLKVNGAEPNHPVCCNKEYNVIGFPTILVVDPTTCSVIKRWGAELYDTHHEAFIKELNGCINCN
jgi:thiol:disulfide interchange protein DsbD